MHSTAVSQAADAEADTSPRAKSYFMAALLLLISPLFIILYQSYLMESGTSVRLPVQLSVTQHSTKPVLITPLNSIDTNKVTGHNQFKIGSEIFVFLSPGPEDIWYPYAISKVSAAQECTIKSCLVLTGRVRNVEENVLHILYQYENSKVPELALKSLNANNTDKFEIVLSVGRDGGARVSQYLLNGNQLPQPKISMPELLGFSQITASAAPAR